MGSALLNSSIFSETAMWFRFAFRFLNDGYRNLQSGFLTEKSPVTGDTAQMGNRKVCPPGCRSSSGDLHPVEQRMSSRLSLICLFRFR